ncbi:DUF982 domain-containing protein [Rhizobium cauense]|uniref:DUF982 domain-containing protein n=1 Tax=Rhizobium cauense TaxID=1166683 RepID=UPI001C6EFC2A|nr:DUF982 domain-containing protein [Rhizobium cauense]MBW9114781.1 DUF982 domain-containing protein [Rhizobium cauense]
MQWHTPVVVNIGSARHVVRGTQEAAWLLADKWPTLTGNSFVRALKACAAALEGRRTQTYARLAFIAAAHHASLVVER